MSGADFWADADLICVYTRAQAIEDGVLVDVTAAAAAVGFRLPVAIHASVAGFLGLHERRSADAGNRGYQIDTYQERVSAALTHCRSAVSRVAGRGTDRTMITLIRRTDCMSWADSASFGDWRETHDALLVVIHIHIHCGPGDDAEPVITICPPDEL